MRGRVHRARVRAHRAQAGGEKGTFFQSLDLASVLNPHAPAGTGRNVIATLEGTDPELKREWVVVGAHYDHLGEGGTPNSLAPGEVAIHNGADDNASGVAAMLWVAERLAAGPRPARSMAFVAFTGEESGLLGSAHYMKHPASGADPIVGMINLDMVGRLNGGTLLVFGVGTAVEWNALLEPAAARAGVTIATKGDGYGPSDHTSFYLKDVPVLHFFTNTHGDYHKPSDDWDQDRPERPVGGRHNRGGRGRGRREQPAQADAQARRRGAAEAGIGHQRRLRRVAR